MFYIKKLNVEMHVAVWVAEIIKRDPHTFIFRITVVILFVMFSVELNSYVFGSFSMMKTVMVTYIFHFYRKK